MLARVTPPTRLLKSTSCRPGPSDDPVVLLFDCKTRSDHIGDRASVGRECDRGLLELSNQQFILALGVLQGRDERRLVLHDGVVDGFATEIVVVIILILRTLQDLHDLVV